MAPVQWHLLIFPVTILLSLLTAMVWPGDVYADKVAAQATSVKRYGNFPLYFISNQGQMESRIAFYERSAGHATLFSEKGVDFQLWNGGDGSSEFFKMVFLHGSANPLIQGQDRLAGKVNFFIGRDPKKWRTNVPTYGSIVYKGLYPGVDVQFYGDNRELEYDVFVAPGADPDQVRFAFQGIRGLNVSSDGALVIALEEGKLIQKAPEIYQKINGKRVEINGRFKLLGADSNRASETQEFSYGFELASYDKNYPLIIDPVLVYSTHLGGTNNDYGSAIAVDSGGNAYVTGRTRSMDFPVVSAYKATNNSGYSDVFVTKFNAAGTALVYSTYLGGSGNEEGNDIAVDASGNAYVIGNTSSLDYPVTATPIQSAGSGGYDDVFVTKLNASGSVLDYSTYLTGSSDDYGYGITVDGAGNAYVTGETHSQDFPTVNPIYTAADTGNNKDAFIAKINAAGTALVYSTYLGGDSRDVGQAIAIDSSGNAYITGSTESPNFPLSGTPLQSSISGGFTSAFVTKINAIGSALVYSTYLGGSNYDIAYGIAVDSAGDAYVTGETHSQDFPAVNALYTAASTGNNRDAFIAKLNAAGNGLVFSTYLGGDNHDFGRGIAVDSVGDAYVIGTTRSPNFPATGSPVQVSNGGGEDVFVTKINALGSALVYSTYLGGTNEDFGMGIAVDSAGSAYVTGHTRSTLDFPTASPIKATGEAGYRDAFVAKLQ